MKGYFIYSALANAITFVDYKKTTSNHLSANEFNDFVTVNGGCGVVNKVNGLVQSFIETEVSKAHFDLLLNNSMFNDYVENGFMAYSNKKLSDEELKDKLTGIDNARPLTETTVKQITKERYKQNELTVKVGNN